MSLLAPPDDSPPGSPSNADVAGSTTIVRYKDLTFYSAESIITYLRGTGQEDLYTVQAEVLSTILEFHERASDMIEEVFKYVVESGAYRRHTTDAGFEEAWAEARAIVQNNQVRRDRKAASQRLGGRKWSSSNDAIEWLVSLGERSATFWASIGTISNALPFTSASLRINHCVAQRLLLRIKGKKNGLRRDKSPQTSDINGAKMMEADPEPVSPATHRAVGTQIGPYGIIEGCDDTLIRDADFGEGSATQLSDEGGQHVELGSSMVLRSHGRGNALARDRDDFLLRSADDDPIDEEAIGEAQAELQEVEAARDLDATLESCDSDGRPTKRRKSSTKPCGCSEDVTDRWCKVVMSKKVYGEASNIRLLITMHKFEHVCYAHSKAMGGHIGLMVKHLNAEQLTERLRIVHDSRLQIGKLKTGNDTYTWFRVVNRPPRPSDALGPYKFAHQGPLAEFEYDAAAILESVWPGSAATWERDGNLCVDVFGWWFDCEIGDIIMDEFEMYRHHLRMINGKSNYGWLRSMFYSIGQQLMRQDLVYYTLKAALRPDRQWRLVTYPYYAKYAVPGDNTYFRHLDLNIPALLASSRGCNMIQGSVSLDEEDEESCTVIIPGMQHKLQEWWERCKARGQDTDGFVHRITEQMFTAEDARVLGLDWKRVPCRRGEVRVTMPHIPHGQDGPATKVRRTMLPWFVGLQDDLESLEVLEGGTWAELSAAHRDLVSPRATPSGLANRYGAIPYRFPAAVKIAGISALSDALVCQRKWDDLLALRDRDKVLGQDRELALAFVKDTRARARTIACEAMQLVREAELCSFADKSYFYHKERQALYGIPFPSVEPDPDSIPPEVVDAATAAGLLFAEEGESDGEGKGGGEGMEAELAE
jgi:hypothetical protein